MSGERSLPRARGVVPPDPTRGGGAATPSFSLAPAATGAVAAGLPRTPAPSRIGGHTFAWGTRTFVMGIVNVTPDSFSGDGLLADDGNRMAQSRLIAAAVAQGRRMVEEGADILDVGGESSRPGHPKVDVAEEIQRVVPVLVALHATLPDVPLSVDTVKPAVAAAALDAGASLVNDVWGVAQDDALARLAAERRVALIVMHNRAEARYTNLMPEVLADLQRALERALAAGVAWDDLIVDPGFGFGKAPVHNLA
ncbi:MAG: dihydropteroate synthase, partial [Candidatus Limnocylindrales bacterium]